jgi:lipoprotein-anchoring transpeptidase ErfK/SrfK
MRLSRPLTRAAGGNKGIVVAAVVLALAAAGGVVAGVTQLEGGKGSGAAASAAATDGPLAIRLAGFHKGHVPWNKHLHLSVANGAIQSIRVTESDGNPVEGTLGADATRWVSTGKLVPTTHYLADVVLTSSGNTVTKKLHFRATDATRHLTALLSPGDGDVVGVGSPVIVRLSRPVADSQRAAVENRLAVSSTPSVIGAWHWMSSQELHWRPPSYWDPHTSITVTSNLDGLDLGHGVWGEGFHQTTFKIGDSHISRVDVARHEMYVYDNRHLIETFPISAGRDKYPTKNGVHITFEKSQVVTMDSATVGIPRNSPDGYYEKVYYDVRISYGGAFVHAAPWSVADQGVVNVSHGCVNLSTEHAIWFYNWSLRGDIVDVYNSTAPVDTADPGMADWNMSWKQWVAGDAAPTGAALGIKPPLPHDSEPGAPSYHSSSTYTPPATTTTTHSATPSPHSTPTARRSSQAQATTNPTPKPTQSPHHH